MSRTSVDGDEEPAGRPERERNCILLGSYPNTALLQRHGIHREEFRRAQYPAEMVWRE